MWAYSIFGSQNIAMISSTKKKKLTIQERNISFFYFFLNSMWKHDLIFFLICRHQFAFMNITITVHSILKHVALSPSNKKISQLNIVMVINIESKLVSISIYFIWLVRVLWIWNNWKKSKLSTISLKNKETKEKFM